MECLSEHNCKEIHMEIYKYRILVFYRYESVNKRHEYKITLITITLSFAISKVYIIYGTVPDSLLQISLRYLMNHLTLQKYKAIWFIIFDI